MNTKVIGYPILSVSDYLLIIKKRDINYDLFKNPFTELANIMEKWLELNQKEKKKR
jgi:hypothetical protein